MVSLLWSAAALRHSYERGQAAVAEPPGDPHAAPLPPAVAPAVPQLPELIPGLRVLVRKN